MLRNTQDLMGHAIVATDGLVGEVEDLYFDDHQWVTRYLVIATGTWLNHRKVLVAPQSLGHPDWKRKQLPATITAEQVRNSPDIDTTKPVSRQHEALFLSHYRHPPYWEATAPPAVGPHPSSQALETEFSWSDEHFAKAVAARDHQQMGDSAESEQHLRSCRAIANYAVRSHDSDIGHIHGFLFADEDWAIRYLIVHTGHWGLGRQFLIAVQWIDEVSWIDSRVSVDLSPHVLKGTPSYNPTEPLDRGKEIELFRYFGRPGYWHNDTRGASH